MSKLHNTCVNDLSYDAYREKKSTLKLFEVPITALPSTLLFSHFEIDVNDLRTDLELNLNITFKATILDNNRLIFIIVLHKHRMSGYEYDLDQTFNGKGSIQLNCYEMIRLDI